MSNNFCKSSKGFVVIGNFPPGYNTRAYDERIECKTYKDALKAILIFMDKPRVYSIQVYNLDTNEMQFISDVCWK